MGSWQSKLSTFVYNSVVVVKVGSGRAGLCWGRYETVGIRYKQHAQVRQRVLLMQGCDCSGFSRNFAFVSVDCYKGYPGKNRNKSHPWLIEAYLSLFGREVHVCSYILLYNMYMYI